MNKLIKYTYICLLLSFILPSGSIFILPLKTLFTLILLVLISIKYGVRFNKILTSIFIIFCCLLLWSVLSLLNGYFTFLSFLKNYFSLLSIVWISYEVYRRKIITSREMVKWLTIVSIFLVSIKILTSFSLTLGIISVEQCILIYKKVFNCDLTTMYLPMGGIMFYRIMLSNDSIPFVVFSFYLIKKDNIIKKLLVIVLMAVYTFIIYSRFIILQFAVLFICSLFMYWKIHRQKRKTPDKIKTNLLVGFVSIILIAFAIVFIFTKTNIVETLIYRFNSMSQNASDEIRDEQYIQLINGFKESIFIGHGTGSYIKNFIRSETTPYSYEMEYLSFLYQFGIIGFVFIIIFTIYLFYVICFKSYQINKNIKAITFYNFIFWVIKPFFNPGFLSSNSGLIIISIFILSIYYTKYYWYEKNKNQKRSLNRENSISNSTL